MKSSFFNVRGSAGGHITWWKIQAWAGALCRELPSAAWRGVFAADIKVPLACPARVKVQEAPLPKG